jgi:23S rRNA (uracil1939-C5)-methyltransferase
LKATRLALETENNLAAGGAALARAPDGRVVFVEGAAPNERVLAEVIEEKKRFLRAKVVDVLSPGPKRCAPECADFHRCGGCALQHLGQSEQLKQKQSMLNAALVGIGGGPVSLDAARPPWSGQAYGYRTRARWAIDRSGKVGYRAKGEHRVISPTDCPILVPPLREALGRLTQLMPSMTENRRWSRSFAEGAGGRRDRRSTSSPQVLECQAVYVPGSDSGAAGGSGQIRLALDPGLTWLRPVLEREGFVCEQSDGPPFVTDDGHGPLFGAADAFAQANPEGNAAILRSLDELLSSWPREPVLELYAGCGNLTRVVLRHASEVTAVESAARGAALANCAQRPGVVALNADAEDTTRELLASGRCPRWVVLNPPRTGIPAGLMEVLCQLKPHGVVYLSCDAATFARDLRRLREGAGLELGSLQMFDLYPQTAHLEVLGRLDT